MRLTRPTINPTISRTIGARLVRRVGCRPADALDIPAWSQQGGPAQKSAQRSAQPTVRRGGGGRPPMSAAVGVRHRAANRRAAWGRYALTVELLVLAVMLTGSAAHAEPVVLAQAVLAQAASVDQVLTNVRNWLMGILAALATVFLSIGGVRYVMANGDPGEIEKAKAAFRSAGVGYGLAALAPLVVTVLQGIVGV
jgi:hypothetical protein